MYALNDLDEKLEKYVDRDGGFFVEAGAYDGINQSNTYYFETRRHWQGLLIEAVPELVEQCRKNRPQSVVHQAALVGPTYTKSTIKMHCCGLMSMVDDAMGSEEKCKGHLELAKRATGASPIEIGVHADTLTNVLRMCFVPRQFDFLSLDVEGYEVEAMSGLDLDIYKPGFILAEVRVQNIKAFEEILGDKYAFVESLSFHDRLYRRSS